MGVPITLLDNHRPDQFELVSADTWYAGKQGRFYFRGDRMYAPVIVGLPISMGEGQDRKRGEGFGVKTQCINRKSQTASAIETCGL